MKKALLILALTIATCLGTSLTGSLKNPDGTGANGTLSFSLAQQEALSGAGGCGGPAEISPTYQVNIKIVNGSMVSPPTIYGNDCMLPAGSFYNIRFIDTNGNLIFTDRWQIGGSSIDIGTIVSVVITGTTATLGSPSIVFTIPTANQTVTQPPGSTLGVNLLNVTNTLVLPNGGVCNASGCGGIFGNVVDITSAQTITGAKTFNSTLLFSGSASVGTTSFPANNGVFAGLLTAGTMYTSGYLEFSQGGGGYQFAWVNRGLNRFSLVNGSSQEFLGFDASAYPSVYMEMLGGGIFSAGAPTQVPMQITGTTSQTADLLDVYEFGLAPPTVFKIKNNGGISTVGIDGVSLIATLGPCSITFTNGITTAVTGGSSCTSGGGGGGSPGAPQYSVQFNNPLGTFAGSSFFIWDITDDVGHPFLKVTATAANKASIASAVGYVQSDAGFLATPGTGVNHCENYNCFNAPNGGGSALSWTSINYTNLGSSNGAPPITGPISSTCPGGSGCGTFNAGAAYYDISVGSPGFKVYNGSAWLTIASGSGAPGGSTNDVQFNGTGSVFAGAGSSGAPVGLSWFSYDPTAHLLRVTSATTSTAGIVNQNGYIQSDQGFLATTGVCFAFNCFNSPGSGMAARSFTADKYIQAGHSATDPPALTGLGHPGVDAFNQGALYWSDTAHCLKVMQETSGTPTTFACVGAGGGSPAGPAGAVQYTTGSAFAGSGSITMPSGVNLTIKSTGISGTDNEFLFENTFSTPIFLRMLMGSGGDFVLANSPQTLNMLVVSQAGNLTTTTVAATSGLTNSIQTAGGMSAVTYTASGTAGNTIQVTGAGGGVQAPNITSTASTWNSVQASSGGMSAINFTASSYVQAGNYNTTPPTAFGGDTLHAGALAYDIGTNNNMTVRDNAGNWLRLLNLDGSGNLTLGSSSIVAKNFDAKASTCSTSAFQTETSSFRVDCSGNLYGQVLNINGIAGSGSSTYVFGGTTTVNGTLTVNNTSAFSSAATFSGGIVTTGNSSINIGSGGNLIMNGGHFFNQLISGGPSCTSGAPPTGNDGFAAYDATTNTLWICGGGLPHAH